MQPVEDRSSYLRQGADNVVPYPQQEKNAFWWSSPPHTLNLADPDHPRPFSPGLPIAPPFLSKVSGGEVQSAPHRPRLRYWPRHPTHASLPGLHAAPAAQAGASPPPGP